MKDSQSWLCGSTNTIVTQQKEIDLLVNVQVSFSLHSPSPNTSSQTEIATLEFRNPRLERLVALTPADRKWIDEIVRDVNNSWDDTDPTKAAMQYVLSSSDLSVRRVEFLKVSRVVMITSELRYDRLDP